MAFIDLSGRTFGQFKVVKRVMKPEGIKSRSARWLCRCNACGKSKSISADCLTRGHFECSCARTKRGRSRDPLRHPSVSSQLYHQRIAKLGWSEQDALTLPCGQRRGRKPKGVNHE